MLITKILLHFSFQACIVHGITTKISKFAYCSQSINVGRCTMPAAIPTICVVSFHIFIKIQDLVVRLCPFHLLIQCHLHFACMHACTDVNPNITNFSLQSVAMYFGVHFSVQQVSLYTQANPPCLKYKASRSLTLHILLLQCDHLIYFHSTENSIPLLVLLPF